MHRGVRARAGAAVCRARQAAKRATWGNTTCRSSAAPRERNASSSTVVAGNAWHPMRRKDARNRYERMTGVIPGSSTCSIVIRFPDRVSTPMVPTRPAVGCSPRAIRTDPVAHSGKSRVLRAAVMPPDVRAEMFSAAPGAARRGNVAWTESARMLVLPAIDPARSALDVVRSARRTPFRAALVVARPDASPVVLLRCAGVSRDTSMSAGTARVVGRCRARSTTAPHPRRPRAIPTARVAPSGRLPATSDAARSALPEKHDAARVAALLARRVSPKPAWAPPRPRPCRVAALEVPEVRCRRPALAAARRRFAAWMVCACALERRGSRA